MSTAATTSQLQRALGEHATAEDDDDLPALVSAGDEIVPPTQIKQIIFNKLDYVANHVEDVWVKLGIFHQ